MQLVQLIQYAKNDSLSMSVSIKVMNVSITSKDLRAYESLGFDTSSFNKDDDCFSFDIKYQFLWFSIVIHIHGQNTVNVLWNLIFTGKAKLKTIFMDRFVQS